MSSTSDQLRVYGQKLRENQHSLSGTVKVLAEAGKDLARGPKPTPTPAPGAYNQIPYPPNTHEHRPFDGGGGGFYNPPAVAPTGGAYAAYNPYGYGHGPGGPAPIGHGQKPSFGHEGGDKPNVWAKIFSGGGKAAGGLNDVFGSGGHGHGHGDGSGGGHDGSGGGGDGGGGGGGGGDGGGGAC